MIQRELPKWLQRFVAVMGGGGLFVVSFLDSSVLSFPFVADVLLIDLSIQRPARMPYYAAMAAVGSLAGSVWIYMLAIKGGQSLFKRSAGAHGERARRWVQGNAVLAMFVASILPPPLPFFKIMVLAEGVCQVPLRTFALSLLLGRALRFFVEGVLAVRYGEVALCFLLAHNRLFTPSAAAMLLLLYVVTRLLFRNSRASP